MNRSAMRTLFRRRIQDTQSVYLTDVEANEELDQALMDVALDVELASVIWRLAKRFTISMLVGVDEYPVPGDFLVNRKLIRTDTTVPVPCVEVLPEELEQHDSLIGFSVTGRSESRFGDSGIVYAIGPDSQNSLAILLPVKPTFTATLLLHYIGTPTAMTDDNSTPADLPEGFHRLIPLKAAMNYLGPEAGNIAGYQAIAAEFSQKRSQMVAFLDRRIGHEDVQDVMGLY